jgi:glycosyltransferase involved in cell wall biosynthesis
MPSPYVSVLMSVFNSEEWLTECIQSVLQSSFRDFEFIIVNDGSTDQSERIILEFSSKDSRIKYFRQKNSGLATALNYGLSFASGKWISRIDADDIAHVDRFSCQIDLANKCNECVVVFSDSYSIDSNGNKIRLDTYPTTNNKLLKNLNKLQRFPAHSSAMIRASSIGKVGGYRDFMRRTQDWDLWYRLSDIGNLCSVNKPMVSIRIHDKQLSFGKGELLQTNYVLLASVCNYWRKTNGVDPIDSGLFLPDELLSLIAKVADNLDYYSENKLLSRLNTIRSDFNGVYLVFKIIDFVFYNPNVLSLIIKRKLFGVNLPKKITDHIEESTSR